MEDFKESFLKKANQIFKLGYVPSRKSESYFCVIKKANENILTGNLCNCLCHACFNFLNEHYKSYDFSEYEMLSTQGFINQCKTKEEISLKIQNFLKSTGLKVEKDSQYNDLKENQWRVALFFDEITFGNVHLIRDFHFMLEEKDKTWSSKENFEPKLNVLNSLPQNYQDYYKLHEVFVLENPFVSQSKKEKIK